ncbi:hypothetical protein AC482_04030 [miscellaneous Crenarchaeota group-15 archaeon DG-45]|uniref:GYD family protein n=1 Tax=miscellaneous Crenarchaeota group-15 archaeon DG-45 TaxID=1685127 RepID=A0A0M0BQ20_9ARCH|nr:MAG: hypothetical protein AC482_04030 [miscellaneous Crenarchaeota group-15 archaeon DG-45]
MPVYVILGRYTQEGVAKIKTSPEKREAAQKVFESIGGALKDFYHTLGQHDFVAVCEAPDEEAMMKALLIIARKGEVRTETLTAIPADKGAEILKDLP